MDRTWDRPAASQIAFAMLLGGCATMIVRPAELIPDLMGLPIYDAFISSALLFGYRGLQKRLSWENLKQEPTTMCLIGVLFSIMASHLARFYLSGAVSGATEFFKVMLLFGLIVSLTDTVSRLRMLLAVLAMSATLTVGLCVLDYMEVLDIELITHISETGGFDEANVRTKYTRMRGTGIFQDPNDLCLIIVFSWVVCTYFLLDEKLKGTRFTLLIPMAILATGLLCTKSRGGLMAAGLGFLILVVCKYGKQAAVLAGIAGLCVLPLIAGRQANIDLGEGGTGHERITLWREGLAALRSPAIVFGVGQGTYEDYAGLVAHNSFIHAFVDLGMIGGTLFLGCFFFPALSLWRLRYERHNLTHPELQRLYPIIVAMLAGWTMSLQSLSRVYVVSTYLMLGVQVAYANLVTIHLEPRRLVTSWDRSHLIRLAVCSVLVFGFFNVFVVVFA